MNTRQSFLIALALLLIMSSLGHVFAAAFCPRMQGRECCFVKTMTHRENSSCSTHEDKTMDGMPMDHMAMHGTHDMLTMDGMVMDEMVADDISPRSTNSVYAGLVEDALEQPFEPCPHCLTHSGFANAPVSSMNVPDESRKAVDSVPLPTFRFPASPVITSASNRLPREHAPPGMSAPRNILNSVFLI
jgi:hypothetical protein